MPKNKKKKSKTEFKIKRNKNYKKKDNKKFEEEINKDDKCFPFIAGSKINRYIGYSISQLNTNINSNLNNSTYDTSFNEEDYLIDNEETDYCCRKFKTKKYYISSEGKKKRIKKIRKYKPDEDTNEFNPTYYDSKKNLFK